MSVMSAYTGFEADIRKILQYSAFIYASSSSLSRSFSCPALFAFITYFPSSFYSLPSFFNIEILSAGLCFFVAPYFVILLHLWSSLLRVLGIAPSFIASTVQAKKFWGILTALSIRSHHDLCTVTAYLSNCIRKIWRPYRNQGISYSSSLSFIGQSVEQYLRVGIVLNMRINQLILILWDCKHGLPLSNMRTILHYAPPHVFESLLMGTFSQN